MKKHKIELSVILSLTIVLTLLAFSIGATISDLNSTENANAEFTYEKYRKASPSLCVGVSIEQRLLGDGEEQVVEVLGASNRLYIFVNTTSTTLDFSQGAGAYICVLDSQLSTVAFHYLGEKTLLSALVGEGGFVLCFENGEGVSLALYGFDCAFIKESKTLEGEFCALKLIDGGYLLSTSVKQNSLSYKRIAIYKVNFDLEIDFSQTLSSSRNMDFICVYQKGANFLVFFNASSDLGSRLGVTLAGKTSSVTYLLKDGDYTVDEVLPVSEGFVAIARGENSGYLIDIDNQFNSDFAHSFEGNFSSTSLFFGTGIYYANFEGENNRSIVFENLVDIKNFDGFKDLKRVDGVINGNDFALFYGESEKGSVVLGGDYFCALEGKDCHLTLLGGEFFAVTKIEKDASILLTRLDF